MGFIEETGAAQHYRDARILPIYEGTNGIQAADLVMRKIGLEGGAVLEALLAEAEAGAGGAESLLALLGDCRAIGARLLASAPDDRLAASYPFLTMLSVAVAGWLLQLQVTALGDDVSPFAQMKRAATRFFLDRIVPEARGLAGAATASAASLYAIPEDAFDAA
jgi:hypothetical protein